MGVGNEIFATQLHKYDLIYNFEFVINFEAHVELKKAPYIMKSLGMHSFVSNVDSGGKI